MLSLINNFSIWNRLTKDNKNKNESEYVYKDKVLMFSFNDIKKTVKIKDLRTINFIMTSYNSFSFLKRDDYDKVLYETDRDISLKDTIYRDFMSYIQVKDWNLKNDFELISDKVKYMFDSIKENQYNFTLRYNRSISRYLLYGYLDYIFLIGEESYNFDQDAGYHEKYSITDFMDNLHDFLRRYSDNVIYKSDYVFKFDSLSNILFSIHEMAYSYLEDIKKINIDFVYPMNTESIISHYEEESEDYDEDSYGYDHIYVNTYVNSKLNFVLERKSQDFIFLYDSDLYVVLYQGDVESYDGTPIGFSLNVAKHKNLIKIRLVITLYLDKVYDEFYIKEITEKNDPEKTNKITTKDIENDVNNHIIKYYEEIDISDVSKEKYKNIIDEINNHINVILEGKILIGFNDNIV